MNWEASCLDQFVEVATNTSDSRN